MKILPLFLIILILYSCNSSDTGMENIDTSAVEVQYFGELQDIMHQGDISAKYELADLEGTSHLYAIGAMEDLKGEIQIFDGSSLNTMVVDSSLQFDKSFEKNATLLVYAVVNHWKSIDIPDSIISYEQLDEFILIAAEKHGIDIETPFPFRIEGTPESFNWHVINWPDGDINHTHNKHVNSGLHGTMHNTAIEMIGFYSTKHHKIFTHHTTNMHLHFRTKDDKLAGHLDGVTLSSGMKLMLAK